MNAENLQILSLLAIGLAVLCGVFIVINVQKAATRLVMLALMLSIGVGAYVYRQDLENCKPSCSCTLGGFKVPDPRCPTVVQ